MIFLRLCIALLGSLLLGLLIICYLCFYMPGANSVGINNDIPDTETELVAKLNKHIVYLSEEIGERHYLFPESLEHSTEYIRRSFKAYDMYPNSIVYGDEQLFEIIYVELAGSEHDAAKIVVGAHYDTVPATLGADDNASGVAALIELVRLLGSESLYRDIILVAFPNEESPFYNTHLMGSQVFADYISDKKIAGMISLEMLGYYSQVPGSQQYPWPINWFYPDTASFIAFVGNLSSRNWLRRSIEAFREHAMVASEGLVAPVSLIPDVARSDQVSFWRHDIPAFMITDTANFRSPYYHFADDTVETLNLTIMSKLVIGLKHMLVELANDKTL